MTTTKHWPSVIGKFVALLIILVAFDALYHRFRFTAARFYRKLSPLVLSCSEKITFDQCRLSLIESDEWFCEHHDEWRRRKKLHFIQDSRNNASETRHLFFQYNWEPTTQCALERRLGNVGDGGKWVCDVHKVQLKKVTPLIYSLGSNGDFSFEEAIKKELPRAEIHTFDQSLYKCPQNTCIFHQAKLGDGRLNGTKSLQQVIAELGHQQREIDILKVDVEGNEYVLFEDFFGKPLKNNNNNIPQYNGALKPYIRQILFEIHLEPSYGDEACRRTNRLFEIFRSNNYAIFHKEVNLGNPQNLFEYGLIRLNAAFFISEF